MADRTRPPASEIKAIKDEIILPGSVPHVRLCAFGRNGSGKTRLGGSFPNVLVIDCNEEGDRSIKGVPGTRVIHVRTWEKIGTIYWYLKTAKHPFKSFAIDTITEMNAMAMDFVLGEAEQRDPTREKSMPGKRDYNRSGMLMRGMLLAYRNLPMNVIFLAQERIVRDPDTQEILDITVDLPAGCRGVAMGSAGILGRLEPKEVRVRRDGKVKREWQDTLRVGEHDLIKTKDRTNLLGPVLREPNAAKIIAAWKANPPKEDED